MIRTNTTLGIAAFIADPSSITLWGTGAQVNWALFTDAKYGVVGSRKIPSGTVIAITNGKIVPAAADGSNAPFYLTRSAAEEDSRVAALSGYGVITGGNVYETLLPDASGSPRVLTAALKTGLGPRFVTQAYQDVR